MELIDPYGRTVRDLRISVTDRCNFRCTYCMPAEGLKWLPREEVLSYEELHRLARICVETFEVDGIRLTGGEASLLQALARRAGEILSREDIGEALGTPDAGERAIDVQVTRLRRKVEPDPREPRFIQTIRHRGYVLRPGP